MTDFHKIKTPKQIKCELQRVEKKIDSQIPILENLASVLVDEIQDVGHSTIKLADIDEIIQDMLNLKNKLDTLINEI